MGRKANLLFLFVFFLIRFRRKKEAVEEHWKQEKENEKITQHISWTTQKWEKRIHHYNLNYNKSCEYKVAGSEKVVWSLIITKLLWT